MKDRFKCRYCNGTGKGNEGEYLKVYIPSRENYVTLETYNYNTTVPCNHCRGTGIDLSKVIEVIETLEKKF